jgi:xanthine dehydrogenase large subunit
VPGIACVENLMEHIAFELKKDPMEVRMANMITEGDLMISPFGPETPMSQVNLMPQMLKELDASANLQARRQNIQDFNKVTH